MVTLKPQIKFNLKISNVFKDSLVKCDFIFICPLLKLKLVAKLRYCVLKQKIVPTI